MASPIVKRNSKYDLLQQENKEASQIMNQISKYNALRQEMLVMVEEKKEMLAELARLKKKIQRLQLALLQSKVESVVQDRKAVSRNALFEDKKIQKPAKRMAGGIKIF